MRQEEQKKSEQMVIFEKIDLIFFVVAQKLITVDTFHQIFKLIYFSFMVIFSTYFDSF